MQFIFVPIYFLFFALLFTLLELTLFRAGMRRRGWLILAAGIAWPLYGQLLWIPWLNQHFPLALDFLRQRNQTWRDVLLYSICFGITITLIGWLTEKLVPEASWWKRKPISVYHPIKHDR